MISLNIVQWTILFSKIFHMFGLSGTLSYAVFVCLCICIFVFVCSLYGTIIFDILEQSPFQKYTTCWVQLILTHYTLILVLFQPNSNSTLWQKCVIFSPSTPQKSYPQNMSLPWNIWLMFFWPQIVLCPVIFIFHCILRLFWKTYHYKNFIMSSKLQQNSK